MIKWFLISMVIVSACAKPERPSPLKNIADKRMAEMNNHDLNQLASLFADSARIASVGFETVFGPAGAKDVYGRYFRTSPDLRYEASRITIGDSTIVIEYTSTGTIKVLEANVPEYMKDKKYTLTNCTRMTVRDGKIIDEMTYFDQVSFLRQMGYFDQQPASR